MSPLLLIVILILFFGLGGGYYGHANWGMYGGVGGFIIPLLIILLICKVLGLF